MCGEDDGHDTPDQASVICAGCAFESFATSLNAKDVPLGHAADRPSPDHRWIIRPMTEEELSDEEE